jgi:hypothetical protein
MVGVIRTIYFGWSVILNAGKHLFTAMYSCRMVSRCMTLQAGCLGERKILYNLHVGILLAIDKYGV